MIVRPTHFTGQPGHVSDTEESNMLDEQEDFDNYQKENYGNIVKSVEEEKPSIPDIKNNIMIDSQSHFEL